MATLTVNTSSRTGLNVNTGGVSAAGGGDKWANSGSELVVIFNGDSSSMTVTPALGVGGAVDGLVPTARAVTVPAGNVVVLGPYNVNLYNDVNGFVNLAYSAVTAVKIAVVRPGT